MAVAGKPATTRKAMDASHKLSERRIADDDFRTETETLDETTDDQLCHVLRECGGNRCKAEHQQVYLIGEAPAVFIADETGDERADGHPDERQREKLQILRQRRKFCLYC